MITFLMFLIFLYVIKFLYNWLNKLDLDVNFHELANHHEMSSIVKEINNKIIQQ